jgi:hypothetical protein
LSQAEKLKTLGKENLNERPLSIGVIIVGVTTPKHGLDTQTDSVDDLDDKSGTIGLIPIKSFDFLYTKIRHDNLNGFRIFSLAETESTIQPKNPERIKRDSPPITIFIEINVIRPISKMAVSFEKSLQPKFPQLHAQARIADKPGEGLLVAVHRNHILVAE